MMTHAEWLTRWAQRWVDDVQAELDHRKISVAEVNAAFAKENEDKQECLQRLIDQHQSVVDNIVASHRELQQFAERWKVNVPDLSL